jgi:hypothetical protein
MLTDMLRNHTVNELDADSRQRKKMPLVIYRFSELSRLGIETYYELLNKFNFPWSDNIRECASDVLTFFPNAWRSLDIMSIDLNLNLSYSEQFFTKGWDMISNNKISVKGIRELLLETLPVSNPPYANHNKFELHEQAIKERDNPYLIIRKSLHSTRDKFYKFRILNGDIFCNSRMHRFGMVESPFCLTCPPR